MSLLRAFRPSIIGSKWAAFPCAARSYFWTVAQNPTSLDAPDLGNPSPLEESSGRLRPNDSRNAQSHSSSPSQSLSATQTSHEQPLHESVRDLLPLLRAQAPQYITAHIHGKPYLVTQGDTLKLPFHMSGVQPGDVLRLNRATILGSRDFTLRAAATPKGARMKSYIDDRLFVCRAVVVGVESEPMRIMEKTKRRQRHVKTVRSKHKYTVLRISELRVNSVEEVETGATMEP